jgi:carboxylesterase
MRIIPRSPAPFFYEGDERGILLIHGFTGSTAEMGPMGKHFAERGFTVHAPLLAGHGTSPEDMANTTDLDWWQSVVQGYERMMSFGCKRIYVAGLSMGGLLALRVARDFPVQGVISMAAPLRFKNKKAYFAWLLHRFTPYSERDSEKPGHIEQHLVPYDRTPVKCVSCLKKIMDDMRRSLARITVPALIVQGGEDETIYPEDAKMIFSRLGSEDKELKWYPNSSHIIVLDHEREQLFADIETFIRRLESNRTGS